MEFEAKPLSITSDSYVSKKGSTAAFYAHISFVPHIFFFAFKEKNQHAQLHSCLSIFLYLARMYLIDELIIQHRKN